VTRSCPVQCLWRELAGDCCKKFVHAATQPKCVLSDLTGSEAFGGRQYYAERRGKRKALQSGRVDTHAHAASGKIVETLMHYLFVIGLYQQRNHFGYGQGFPQTAIPTLLNLLQRQLPGLTFVTASVVSVIYIFGCALVGFSSLRPQLTSAFPGSLLYSSCRFRANFFLSSMLFFHT
jgi:hypothetical protein